MHHSQPPIDEFEPEIKIACGSLGLYRQAIPLVEYQNGAARDTSSSKRARPPQRACWLANKPHRVETAVCSAFTPPEDPGALLAESGIVSVSELLPAAIIALGIAQDLSAERIRRYRRRTVFGSASRL